MEEDEKEEVVGAGSGGEVGERHLGSWGLDKNKMQSHCKRFWCVFVPESPPPSNENNWESHHHILLESI